MSHKQSIWAAGDTPHLMPHSPLFLLVWFPRPVWLCCSTPFPLALLGGACALLLLPHSPVPPYEDFASPHDVDCPVRGGLVTALLPPLWRAAPCARGAAPDLVEEGHVVQRSCT